MSEGQKLILFLQLKVSGQNRRWPPLRGLLIGRSRPKPMGRDFPFPTLFA